MKKLMFAFLCIGILCFAQNTYATSIEDVIVEGKGTGKTREEAINAALVEAISKVRGMSVSSASKIVQSLTAQTEEKSTDDTTSTNVQIEMGETSKQDIQTATSGIVKRYEIISETPSEISKGYVDIVLSVTISKYKESIASQRKRIAVVPFKLKQNTRLCSDFSDLLSQEIVNFLTQTRRFAILDRDYLSDKHDEFNLLMGDDVKTEERARIGNTLGTDYLLAGTLLYAQAKVEKKPIPYTNKFSEVLTVEAALSWRLIEAATGQVLLSKNTHFERDIKENAKTDSLWMHTPVAYMGEEIARDVMDNIYPLMPVSYANGLLTIPQGGETVEAGQLYTMIKYGNIVYDPYTKEAIAREETEVGTVEIAKVSPKLAYAKIIKTSLKEKDLTSLKPLQYILRPIDAKATAKIKKQNRPAPVPTQTPNW